MLPKHLLLTKCWLHGDDPLGQLVPDGEQLLLAHQLRHEEVDGVKAPAGRCCEVENAAARDRVVSDTSSELRVLRPALFSRLALASMSSLAVSLAMSALLNLGNLKATFSSWSAVTG